MILWLHLPDLHLPLPGGDDPVSRLAFAARWLLLPAVALFAGIAVVANQRFFVVDAIDGARASQSRLIEITLRYDENTLEQVVLAAIAGAGLALNLPHQMLTLIPAMAIVFLAGRALFWIGLSHCACGARSGYGPHCLSHGAPGMARPSGGGCEAKRSRAAS